MEKQNAHLVVNFEKKILVKSLREYAVSDFKCPPSLCLLEILSFPNPGNHDFGVVWFSSPGK